MRQWDYVDSEPIPDDDGRLFLVRRGGEYTIHVDGRELMSNREHGSEDALADLTFDRLADPLGAHALVGGMGMGFTAAAVLRRLGPHGRVTIAELLGAVVRWNREYVGRAAGHPLRDERVDVYIGDVADLVEAPPTRYSAIMLDVDNGPQALTRPNNGWLYTKSGVLAAYAALIPGGVLGIWSAHRDPSLTRRLRRAGFLVEVIDHTEDGRPTEDGSGTHVLWMARTLS